MRIAHLDCSSGASGDMWLGALVSAGASLEGIQNAVDTLGVGNVRVSFARVDRGGERAVAVRVRAPEETPPVQSLGQITNILEYTALDEPVRRRAVSIFTRLAEAEAFLRRRSADEIVFHEVGTLDTLADVVGVTWAMEQLGIEAVTCGPIATGSGVVETARGRRNLPDPLVVSLLDGFHLVPSEVTAELVTPTGAALVAEYARPVRSAPDLEVEQVGVGAGHHHHEHPSVLRLEVGVAHQAVTGRPLNARAVSTRRSGTGAH